MINYIIWNGSPELFSVGSFSLRWYGLLFALGFLISQQVLYYIFKKEGKPQSDVDLLTVYMVLATLIGARLGHIIFYQPEILWTNPLGVFLPFEFTPKFRFVGLRGLASHGGAIGILVALWMYGRKKKPGQNYLQILDRIVIVVALTGALIRLGNFFNSEIIGKPTASPLGVVFVGGVTKAIMEDPSGPGHLESIKVEKSHSSSSSEPGKKPIDINLTFKPDVPQPVADRYIKSNVEFYLSHMNTYVELPDTGLRYNLSNTGSGNIEANVTVLGIARHPSQLYESISSFLLFLLLLGVWSRKKEKTPTGLIFGIFMIILWGLRFLYEFLKENQVPFENSLPLNMGQILSIPLFITGIIILARIAKSSSATAE